MEKINNIIRQSFYKHHLDLINIDIAHNGYGSPVLIGAFPSRQANLVNSCIQAVEKRAAPSYNLEAEPTLFNIGIIIGRENRNAKILEVFY